MIDLDTNVLVFSSLRGPSFVTFPLVAPANSFIIRLKPRSISEIKRMSKAIKARRPKGGSLERSKKIRSWLGKVEASGTKGRESASKAGN